MKPDCETRRRGPISATAHRHRKDSGATGVESATRNMEVLLTDTNALIDRHYVDGAAVSMSQIVVDEGLKAAFWRPHYLPLSAWLEHIPFAFWLMSQHRPRTFVELGTHYGASYFAFCQAVELLSLDTRCYAVDTWTGDEHAGFYGDDVHASVSARNSALYSRFSSLIRANFSDTARYFEDNSIDLLHLDGLHTEDAVRKDIETWMPKLSKRAVLLLHDTNVRERNFGVGSVLTDLRLKYPVFEFAHGHGLGVIAIGKTINSGVKDLLESDTRGSLRRDVSNFFARLGRACSDAYKVDRAEQKRIEMLSARGSETNPSSKTEPSTAGDSK